MRYNLEATNSLYCPGLYSAEFVLFKIQTLPDVVVGLIMGMIRRPPARESPSWHLPDVRYVFHTIDAPGVSAISKRGPLSPPPPLSRRVLCLHHKVLFFAFY